MHTRFFLFLVISALLLAAVEFFAPNVSVAEQMLVLKGKAVTSSKLVSAGSDCKFTTFTADKEYLLTLMDKEGEVQAMFDNAALGKIEGTGLNGVLDAMVFSAAGYVRCVAIDNRFPFVVDIHIDANSFNAYDSWNDVLYSGAIER